MGPKKKQSTIDTTRRKKAIKEGKKIRNLLAEGQILEARESALEWLSANPNEPVVSCFLLIIKGGVADWDEEFLPLHDRLRQHFRSLLDRGPKDITEISGIFDDWSFLFYGMFTGQDIKAITLNHWTHPDEDDDDEDKDEIDIATTRRPKQRAVKQAKKRIKICYMTSYVHNHALCHLFCGIPQSHNKETCSVTILDTSKFEACHVPNSEMDHYLREIVRNGSDDYHPCGGDKKTDIVKWIKKQNFDVLIALDGLMENNRLDLLEYKLAPVTCTVLGFPSTTGCPDLNYIIVDQAVANPLNPEEKFSERLATMPISCYVGSHKIVYPHLTYNFRAQTAMGEKFIMSAAYTIPSVFTTKEGIEACWKFLREKAPAGKKRMFGHVVYDGSAPSFPDTPTTVMDGITLTARFHFGLPEKVVIFGAFNPPWKADPQTFSVWMKILTAVPDSVLWIKTCNNISAAAAAATEANYRRAAGPLLQNRLIFHGYIKPEANVRRGALADVCLDTTVCTGHTTFLDEVWMDGVVVTCPGIEFHQRVACSILQALCLPSLCSASIEEYEETAIFLALHPDNRAYLQEQVSERKLRSIVYDTNQFAHDLEQLYRKMLANYEANPDSPSLWDNVETDENGEEMLQVIEDIDTELLKAMGKKVKEKDATTTNPPPRQMSVSPGPCSAPAATPSPPQPMEEEKQEQDNDRLHFIYHHPTQDYISSNKLYFGQRCINVAWIETFGINVFLMMEENYDKLYIGPLMAVQFVELLKNSLGFGAPKYPKKKEERFEFFKSRKNFRNCNWQQYTWMSTMLDGTGRMIETPNPQHGICDSRRRIDKSKCFACPQYDTKPVLVATLLEKHVPMAHTWYGHGEEEEEKCPECGILKELFDSDAAYAKHVASHRPPPVANEGYLPPNNNEDLQLLETHVWFPLDFEGDNILEREVEKYNKAAKDQKFNPLRYQEGKWMFQKGQKMASFIWAKEAFQDTMIYLKNNAHLVAASGASAYQFLHIYKLHLMNPFCPRFQNLGMMDADARKAAGPLLHRYKYRSSYEYMCQIFNPAGEVEDEGGKWQRRWAIPPGTVFCSICRIDMNISVHNVHQKMTLDHIVDSESPSCEFCGFLFGKHMGDEVEVIQRQLHAAAHAGIESWKERIFDAQDEEETLHEYTVKFHE